MSDDWNKKPKAFRDALIEAYGEPTPPAPQSADERRDAAAEKYANENYPGQRDVDREDRFDTRMLYEISYDAERAFCAGWDAREPEIAEARKQRDGARTERAKVVGEYLEINQRLERELKEAKGALASALKFADMNAADTNRLSKENAELKHLHELATQDMLRAEKERDELRAAAEENEQAFQLLDKAHDLCVIARDELKARAKKAEAEYEQKAQTEYRILMSYAELTALAEKMAAALGFYKTPREYTDGTAAQDALAAWARWKDGK